MISQKRTMACGLVMCVGILSFACFGCQSAPKNVVAVADFEVDRYLGKWYEVARFDFVHEKNMDNVTAEYSMNDDGSIRVKNRGYNYVKDEWKESIGKAKFQGSPAVGALKVSFFGPFYSGYNVIALDPNYQSALVSGKNYDYLWILSRTPSLPEATKTEYLEIADSLGFDIDKLVWVEHNPYR